MSLFTLIIKEKAPSEQGASAIYKCDVSSEHGAGHIAFSSCFAPLQTIFSLFSLRLLHFLSAFLLYHLVVLQSLEVCRALRALFSLGRIEHEAVPKTL